MSRYSVKLLAPDDFERETRNRPVLVPLADVFDTEDFRWCLLHPWAFDAWGRSWSVDAGYVFDGASVPSVAWRIAYSPAHSAVMRAALAHDWCCDNRDDLAALGISNVDAARLFRKMLLEDGADPVKARRMDKAVRYFGPQWG